MSVKVHTIKAGMAFCHLVESSEGLVLIDAGSPGKEHEILRHLKRLGRDDLRLILITHAHLDHYGSAAALRRETGALVAIHAADAEPMAKGETRLGSARYWGFFIKLILPWVEKRVGPEPVAADILLADGDDLRQFGLPGRIVHTPGHTPGSCSVIVSDGIAFVGDLVSPMGRPHAQLLYAHDWGELAKSLGAIQALHPERVYSGHGEHPIDGSTFQRIRAHWRAA